MSYMVYVYQKTPPKNLEYAHQWSKRAFGRSKIYTHALFGGVVDAAKVKKALNVPRSGIYKLKNLQINYDLMPKGFQKHLEFLKNEENVWTKRKKEIVDNADFSDLLISI